MGRKGKGGKVGDGRGKEGDASNSNLAQQQQRYEGQYQRPQTQEEQRRVQEQGGPQQASDSRSFGTRAQQFPDLAAGSGRGPQQASGSGSLGTRAQQFPDLAAGSGRGPQQSSRSHPGGQGQQSDGRKEGSSGRKWTSGSLNKGESSSYGSSSHEYKGFQRGRGRGDGGFRGGRGSGQGLPQQQGSWRGSTGFSHKQYHESQPQQYREGQHQQYHKGQPQQNRGGQHQQRYEGPRQQYEKAPKTSRCQEHLEVGQKFEDSCQEYSDSKQALSLVLPPTSTSTEGQILQDKLASSMSQISVSSVDPEEGKGMWIIPKRNKPGTKGRRIEIEVNHLLLTFDSTKTAIHYDCAFKPEKISKKNARLVMEVVRQQCYNNRHPAFDGKKNLFSSGNEPLFQGEQIVHTVSLPGNREDQFSVEVTIKQVRDGGIIDMSLINDFLRNGGTIPQKALQVLDIALRNPSALRCTSVGRSFFTRPEHPPSLGSGYELWYGFYQSAILGWQPFLNVDVVHKGFPVAKNVLEVMLEIKENFVRRGGAQPTVKDLEFGLKRFETEDFSKFIKGLRVEFEIPGRPSTRRAWRVNGIKEPCNQHSFVLDNGQRRTVYEYFKKEKQFVLKYPKLPCLHVGDAKKDICIPPELCKILPNQVVMKKLDKNQTTKMIRESAQPPHERKERVMQGVVHTDFNHDPCVREFGVSVASEFQRVNARILDAPILEYGRNNQVLVSNGEWRADRAHFISPMHLRNWVIVSASPFVQMPDLRHLAEMMIQVGTNHGMRIEQPQYEVLVQQQDRDLTAARLKQLLSACFSGLKAKGNQLAVVAFPDRVPNAYGLVKLIAEVEVGLLTSCIRERTFSKLDVSTVRNIIMKVNAKLNGKSHTVLGSNCPPRVAAQLKGTMLMGADVTHPSPDQKLIPSVAAVTASYDNHGVQYTMMSKLQSPRQEIIDGLRVIVRKQIQFYKSRNGSYPERIIYYRDGVSEGQFMQVLQEEMTAIRWACFDVVNQEIPVTFLVVQKRHHTRFFPTQADHTDRRGNVPPGTVVDTTITHPTEMDFYMVSHASLKGTSRPTKYHKLWDGNNIDEDTLEELTYYLCHLFSRCTRSVSYPAPTYYAHLAAARRRVYIEEGSNIDMDNLEEETERQTVRANITNGSPMFFI